MTESITINGLHIISLALTTSERWEAASAGEVRLMVMLTVLAVLTLIISLILLFWARANYRHIAKLEATNENLMQEIANHQRRKSQR